MKISIVTLGRSHLLNLARVLDTEGLADVTFYTMMPAARCRKFGYHGKVKSLLFPCGLLSVMIDRLPINPFKKSNLRFYVRKLFDALCAMRLSKCDVVIGLNGQAVKTSLLAKKRFKAITICDQGSSHVLTQTKVRRSYSDAKIPEDMTAFMLKHYEAADYLMAATKYVIDSDIQNGISKDKILINPYGVDITRFEPLDVKKEYDVIMVGSWWKHKGCDMLTDACLNHLKGVKMLHVGNVVDCELPKNDNFHHVDFVNEFDLPQYYRKAKVSVMPSLDEGFGLVLLQAASCGLPSVYSNRTGGPELQSLLKDDDWSFEIKEPLSTKSIAEAISQALKKVNESEVKDTERFENTRNNLSWESYGHRYLKILEGLIKSENQ
ncbi:MAG: glycosyltransferase [Bacteroidales bacterium]|nr:glycosyltransferase [Bacteroidales bacterium]